MIQKYQRLIVRGDLQDPTSPNNQNHSTFHIHFISISYIDEFQKKEKQIFRKILGHTHLDELTTYK